MNYQNIKTWEDACKVHNVDPKKLPEVSMLPVKFQNWLINTYKMGIITEAINTKEDGKIWIPNWNDSNQWKYFPWFEIKATKSKPSGVGFSDSDYDFWHSNSYVGSRLCFETREQVYHVQEHFKDIFIEMFLIKD